MLARKLFRLNEVFIKSSTREFRTSVVSLMNTDKNILMRNKTPRILITGKLVKKYLFNDID